MEKVIKKLLKIVVLIVAAIVLIDIFTGGSDEAARAYSNMSASTAVPYGKQDFANYTLQVMLKGQNDVIIGSVPPVWGECVLEAAEEAFRLYGTTEEAVAGGAVKEHAGRMVTYLYNNIDSSSFSERFAMPVTLGTAGVVGITEAWCAKFVSVVLKAAGAIDGGVARKNVNANQLFIDLYSLGNKLIVPDGTFISDFGRIGWSDYSVILSLVDPAMKSRVTAAIDLARRESELPMPGDIAFVWYNHESVKRLGHVGIVVSYSEDEMVLIEGNNAYASSFYTVRSGDKRDNSLVIKRTYRADDTTYPVYKRCIVFIRLQ